jgi:hypothetical protein
LPARPHQPGVLARAQTNKEDNPRDHSKSIVILMARRRTLTIVSSPKTPSAECKLPGELHFVEDGEQLSRLPPPPREKTQVAPTLVGTQCPAPWPHPPRPQHAQKRWREALREIKNTLNSAKFPSSSYHLQADTDIAQIYRHRRPTPSSPNRHL